MLVLGNLHNYLAQILSPPSIHTALLLTPEGALVSYASQMENKNDVGPATSPRMTPTMAPAQLAGDGLPSKSTELDKGVGGVSGTELRLYSPSSTMPRETQARSKDEIRIVAGLSAEVWAETRGTEDEEGTVESELGRVLVLPVEAPAEDPLLLLALNGTTDAQWEAMSSKARKLSAFLAPAVNKYRGQMQPVSLSVGPGNGGGAKSRTRSAATSPGRVTR
ncbi:hypothetical protein V8B97DRAFT_953909 [Scleroderma yunnanense]